MTVDGIFKTNNAVELLFNEQLTVLITELDDTLRTAFPGKNIYLVGFDNHIRLTRILTAARNLSYNLQRGCVSYQLKVTLSRSAFGPGGFGLDRILSTGRKVLLEPKWIAEEELGSLYV